MTTLRIDAEAIQALGTDLATLAEALETLGELDRASTRDLGHNTVSAALDELLGNWSLMRGQLARALDDLGAVAGEAGAAYLSAEAGIVDSLGCTPRSCPGAGIPR